MMKQFVTFRLDEQLFGVDVLLVREINQQMDLTQVQQAPDYVRGLINLRGHIVTILDLGIRLGIAPRQIDQQSHNVVLKRDDELVSVRSQGDREVLKTGPDAAGLLVDAVGDVVAVPESEVEPPPASIGEVSGRFLSGVVKLEGDLLVLLNVENVLEVARRDK